MIKTVFLDLDDTLLHTNTNKFVEQYLIGMTNYAIKRYPALAEAKVSPGKALQRALGATFQNLDPTLTNAAVFGDALEAMLEVPVTDLQVLFDEYNGSAFPQMISLTSRIDNAASLIERLGEMGIGVVIATNPVFTLDSIQHRLTWAGLDNPRVPFAFVSHINDLHFTKPNPQYYEELLARTGAEADETIMVGDSLTEDMIPAAKAGLNTFWIDWGNLLPDDFPADLNPDGNGTLADFERLVGDGWLATLKTRPRTPDQVIPRLMGNVGALFGLVDTMKPEYWNMRPDPNEWSPLELLCHLRDSERNVQRPRLERIANENNPFISQTQPPPGPGMRDLSGEDGNTVLRQFWDERCHTLTFLSKLPPEAWSRPARHSIFGPTTLLEMADFTAHHDRLHINQLCQTIGRCQQALH
jgi:HAD superfamily hydrolase (TIGR01549 family)